MPEDTPVLVDMPEDKQYAIYWSELLERTVPRDQPGGFFHLSRGRCVIDVAQEVDIRFVHSSGSQRWLASAGDLVLKVNRLPSIGERKLFKSLGGGELQYVTIGRLYSDDDALNTALRATLRHTLRSIGGRREQVLGRWIMIPGKIQRVIDELERTHLEAQYRGVLAKARELRRIQLKIETGFRTAHNSLMEIHDGLRKQKIEKKKAIDSLMRIGRYLETVASVNPYWLMIADDHVCRLARANELYYEDDLLSLALRADAAIEKGWRGTRVAYQPRSSEPAEGIVTPDRHYQTRAVGLRPTALSYQEHF